jgi:hypothetical protein
MGHERIMLLFASRSSSEETEFGFERFYQRAMQWPLFHDTQRIAVGATCVLTYVAGQGWRAWGARRKSEWTYATALHEALTASLLTWEADGRAAEPASSCEETNLQR